MVPTLVIGGAILLTLIIAYLVYRFYFAKPNQIAIPLPAVEETSRDVPSVPLSRSYLGGGNGPDKSWVYINLSLKDDGSFVSLINDGSGSGTFAGQLTERNDAIIDFSDTKYMLQYDPVADSILVNVGGYSFTVDSTAR